MAYEAGIAAAAATVAVGLSKEKDTEASIVMPACSTCTRRNPLAALLAHQRYIINDGGMGTLLEALIGVPLDPKLW